MTPEAAPPLRFRCGRAARWLPRLAAAVVLLASMLVAYRFDAWRSSAIGFPLQAFLILVGGAMGLWILRSGAEVRLCVSLDDERLTFRYGKRWSVLALASIDRFEFDHPMTQSRRLLPAAVLIDDRARAWRLPAVLESGDRLIGAIVRRTGRDDLEAWADSLLLEKRMRRAGLITAVGYGLTLLVAAAALWFYAH